MPVTDIFTPTNIKDAIKLVQNGGIVLSGGQALLPDLRQGKYFNKEINLIELSNISEIEPKLNFDHNKISIGALTSVAQLIENKEIKERAGILIEACEHLGDCQIRNSATLGGNLCWGESRANLLIALIALSASVKIIDHSEKVREVYLDNFYRDKILSEKKDFILLSVNIPIDNWVSTSYQEFSRQKNDLALVNLATVELEGSLSGCIGGLFESPFKFKIENKEQLLENTISLVKNAKLEKLKNQYADFEHRLNILKSLLAKTSKVK